jgi:hypothetical protein
MKPEKQQLIDDLLAGESRREATLLASSRILHRRRQWRAGRRIVALAGVVVVGVILVGEQRNRLGIPAAGSLAAKPAAPASVHFLTDAELLALFPDTPVGLAKIGNGKEILIFPRPGDEARFITRL